MGDWVHIGPHRYRVVDELVYLETAGAFVAEHAETFLSLLRRLDAEQQDLGLFIDLHGGLQLPPESRRILAAQTDRTRAPLPTLVVGANPALRALVTLILNGIRLLIRVDVPIRFCKDKELDAAMIWLREKVRARSRRNAILSAGGSQPSQSSQDDAR